MENFAQRVRQLRKESGKTQTQMAAVFEISARQYQNYEGGGHYPDVPGLMKMADYFGVTVGYLMGTEEEEPNATDKENNPIVLDDDALELLEELKERPEMRTLFSVSRKATKEDILKAVKIIEALKGDD